MNPPVGPSSILGWLTAAAGLVVSVALSIEEHEALFTQGHSKVAAVGALIALIATKASRTLQSFHLNKAAAVAGDVARVPAALAALAGEAQENLKALQGNPDGVDGAHVEFSGAEPPPAAQA